MTGEKTERGRLFVALELPLPWRVALADLQERAKAEIARDFGGQPPRIRWSRPEGTHLTLKFLGEVEMKRVPEMERRLQGSLGAGFELALGGPGTFADGRPPRVLFASVQGAEIELGRLATFVDDALAGEGFAPEKRPFQAHLTLARLPEDTDRASRLRVGQRFAALSLGSVPRYRVKEAVIFRSHLGQGGARYEKLAVIPLSEAG